jgi:hypothetical protein
VENKRGPSRRGISKGGGVREGKSEGYRCRGGGVEGVKARGRSEGENKRRPSRNYVTTVVRTRKRPASSKLFHNLRCEFYLHRH